MADSPFNRGRFGKPAASGPNAAKPVASGDKISCRATNPLSLQDDLNKVFLDERQAKATTATRMFRNDELFDAMTKIVIPGYLQSNRTGKFCMWSTGCSSGEEVYSMAMIALNEFAKAKRPLVMEACGTDINPQRIGEARMGTYLRPSRDSLSANYWRILQNYAVIGEHEIQMSDLLLGICRFFLFDMRKCPKKHTFHFIVCNHVLQYYDAPGQQHIIGNLKAVLKPGGFLYLEGVTEHGMDGSGLEKLPNAQNLYIVGGKGGLFGKK